VLAEEIGMTLTRTLDGMREEMADSPGLHERVAETVAELKRNGAALHAIGVGDPFPDFLLPDPAGSLVERDELLAEGPIVVTFFRGHWCSFCVAAVDALVEALPAMRQLGARLVAVTPETGGQAQRAGCCSQPGFNILADVDHGLALSCGIAFKSPTPLRELLTGRGLDLMVRQGSEAWFLPVPATFVVDRDGIVRWSFVDVDFTRRAEPSEVLAALRGLSDL
jgi:peroxiredoxin